MTPEHWTAVDRYFAELLVPNDPALEGALASSEAAGLPPIQVSPLQGKFLWLLAKVCGARSILEIGTLGGYSALWLARALPPGGRLVTLEVDPKHAEVALGNLARAGLADRVEIKVGRAVDTLPRLQGPFDLIFIDADKAGYPDYLRLSLGLSRPGTVIVADNVVRRGEVIDADSADQGVQGVRKFNELVAAEPRLGATALQTVGAKGYDGFVVAIVN